MSLSIDQAHDIATDPFAPPSLRQSAMKTYAEQMSARRAAAAPTTSPAPTSAPDTKTQMREGAVRYNNVKNYINTRAAEFRTKKKLSPAEARAAAVEAARSHFGAEYFDSASKGAGLPGGPGSIASRAPARSLTTDFDRAARGAAAYRRSSSPIAGSPLDDLYLSSPAGQSESDLLQRQSALATKRGDYPTANAALDQFSDLIGSSAPRNIPASRAAPANTPSPLDDLTRELSHKDTISLVKKTAKTNPQLARSLLASGKRVGYSMRPPESSTGGQTATALPEGY